MSNEEKKIRSDYRQNRLKWIKIQTVFVAILSLIAIILSVIYTHKNKEYYINYTETGSVDYIVNLTNDDFYGDDANSEGEAYISSTIENIIADFNYKLVMDASDVDYEYTYRIDAVLEVVDKSTNMSIYNPTFELISEKKAVQNSKNNLFINEVIKVDYQKYNRLANMFLATYDLSNTIATLYVQTHINVISECEDFENNNTNEYVISLSIPVATKIANVVTSTSVPSGESRVLACKGADKDLYKTSAITISIIDGLFILVLLAYIYLTRNNDINYSIKVKRIVSNYKSFIQKINNDFNTENYQVLNVETLEQMLDIRDTILKPILMFENEDQTATRFYIPTDSSIVYVYQVEVEGSDEVYVNHPTLESIIRKIFKK